MTNKGDLISREALKKHIIEIFETEEKIDKKWAMGLKYSLKIIDLAPTVELRMGRMTNGVIIPIERPQGEWIAHWSEDLQKMGFRQCSKCKAGYQLYEHGTRKSDLPWIDGQQYTLQRIGNFCPNCGAKMQKGSSE